MTGTSRNHADSASLSRNAPEWGETISGKPDGPSDACPAGRRVRASGHRVQKNSWLADVRLLPLP